MTRVDVFDQFEFSWKEIVGTVPVSGMVGAINNCTFKFWRNRWLTTWELLFGKSMRTIYNECSSGVDYDINSILQGE